MFVIGLICTIFTYQNILNIFHSRTLSLTQKLKAFGHGFTAKINLSAGKQKRKETFMQLTGFQF